MIIIVGSKRLLSIFKIISYCYTIINRLPTRLLPIRARPCLIFIREQFQNILNAWSGLV